MRMHTSHRERGTHGTHGTLGSNGMLTAPSVQCYVHGLCPDISSLIITRIYIERSEWSYGDDELNPGRSQIMIWQPVLERGMRLELRYPLEKFHL